MEKLYYTTLKEDFSYEIPKIKGSRFFLTAFPVDSKEAIDEKILFMRKKYFDATHNCYAWRLGVNANQDLFWSWSLSSQSQRANDDGEPSNSSWKPILSVLTGKEVFNTLAVVTRYFWGTLLGVGGLIQAYTETTQIGLEHAPFIKKEICKDLFLSYTYEEIADLQYLFRKYEPQFISQEYGNHIKQKISVNIALIEELKKELIERQINFSDS